MDYTVTGGLGFNIIIMYLGLLGCGELFYFIIGEVSDPYYYGTHYSSAMSVASFLVRMEPFTQHFIKLQVHL